MAADFDLIACYWTLAGAYSFGTSDESPWDLRDRATAAARAGYTGIGIKQADLRRCRDRYGYRGIRGILDDSGLPYLELEVLFDWFAGGRRRSQSDADRADLLEAAAELGAHHVKVCGDFAVPGESLERLHDEFQTLALEARAADTILALEYLPISNVDSLARSLAVLGESAGNGAGIMLDLWHVSRTRTPLHDIAALPASHIACAELADGTLDVVDNELSDTLNRRQLPGDGEFDVRGFVQAVWATGYRGPVGVEIISDTQRARTLEEAAVRSFRAAHESLRAALG